MSSISNRVAKLEQGLGTDDDFERWLRTASDQELNQRLIELMAKTDAAGEVVAWDSLSEPELIALAKRYLFD